MTARFDQERQSLALMDHPCIETNHPEEVKKWQTKKDKLGKTPLSK